MIDEKGIVVVSPSYMRGKTLTRTAKYLPWVTMAVHEFEANEYEASGHKVVVIPDAVRGSIARVRNWLLKRFEKAEGLVMLDDDVTKIYRWDSCEAYTLESADVLEFFEQAFILTREAGFKLWGLSVLPDKSAYRENTPFSFISPILGPVCGHLPGGGLRYDERMPLKEDYDFFLQHVNKFRGVFRFNAYQYVCDHKKLLGGCGEYRNMKVEQEQFALFRKKWGSRIIATQHVDGRHDNEKRKSRKHRFDTNPLIRVPISGV